MSFFETSDHVKLSYHITGNGRPLVLLTGFGGYQEIWTDQVAYLNKMGYAVLTYDHRNMGRSQRTAKGQTLKRLTTDLVELLTFLKISHASFIGHSMGGSVLYHLLRSNPEVVDLGMIIDQSPYMLNNQSWKYGFLNYTAENFQKETLNIPKVHETLHGIDRQILTCLTPVKIAYPFDRLANINLLREHVQLDWRQTIRTTQRKLIIFAAKKSPYYNYQFANWAAAQNDKITAVIVENCGHDIMAEIPQQFNQLVRHFLLQNHYLP